MQAKLSMTQSQLRTNEAELIKSVCEGEQEAFYELVRPYERMIYATAISVVKNPADAEEIAQEAVLKAFSHLCSFRGESRFSTWLVQITYNEAKMRAEEGAPAVLRKNSIQRFSTQCNIVTSDRRVRAVQLYILNIADFKGVPAG